MGAIDDAGTLLEARGLRHRFGRKEVLRGVDLTLRAGETVGLVGENGCGKTTLVNVLAGYLRPREGTVQRRGRAGFCPQQAMVYPHLRVEEHFELFAAAGHLKDWRAEMDGLLESLRFGAERRTLACNLSGGTRQKLDLSLALLGHPPILLLDEPFQGFDRDSYARFWRIVSARCEKGTAVLVAAHLLLDVPRVSRMLELRDGRIEGVSPS